MDQHHGRTAARLVKSKYVGGNSPDAAAAYASSQNWLDAHQIIAHEKAVVTAMSTNDIPVTAVGVDFSGAVRPLTIIGRLQGMRPVPGNVRIITADVGTRATFVGQGKPIPASAADLSGTVMFPLRGLEITNIPF